MTGSSPEFLVSGNFPYMAAGLPKASKAQGLLAREASASGEHKISFLVNSVGSLTAWYRGSHKKAERVVKIMAATLESVHSL